jgi:O-antigen/teichoic acid export membrane protein
LKTITQIKKHAAFGLVFTIAKATVYFVPLLLADVLSGTDFGVLEYALAGLGMVVNTIINLGVPGAYPYFVLREKRLELQASFKLHPIILLIPLVVNQVLFFFLQLDVNFYFAFNVSYIIANQVFYSTQLKSHEKSIAAVILDSGIYVVLLVFYILSLLGIVEISIKAVSIFVALYCLVYVFYSINNFFKHKSEISFTKYKTILKFSVHLLISTFLIFLITTSGRILVEYFFDFTAVGVYAFYFRLSAVVVMIYQIISITFFKKIYTLDPVLLDKYYHLFFIFIYVLSIMIFFIAPYFVGYVSNYFNETYLLNKSLYFLLSAQMVMWIASALNSSIIDRESLAPKNNIKFLTLVISSIILLYFVKNQLTLALLTFLHMSIIFIACLVQYSSLYSKRINFKKSAITLVLIYLVTSSYYIFTF